MWKTVSRKRMRKWREKKKEWCPLPIHRHAMDCWFCVKHITCEWWAGILWFLFGNMVQNWTILYASLFVCLREWCCRSCHISFDILWKYLRQLNWPVVMLLIMDKIYISTSKKEIEFRFSLFSCSISLSLFLCCGCHLCCIWWCWCLRHKTYIKICAKTFFGIFRFAPF